MAVPFWSYIVSLGQVPNIDDNYLYGLNTKRSPRTITSIAQPGEIRVQEIQYCSSENDFGPNQTFPGSYRPYPFCIIILVFVLY